MGVTDEVVVVVMDKFVLIVHNIGVWGIGCEVRRKPRDRWKVFVANWLVSVVPMVVMMVPV